MTTFNVYTPATAPEKSKELLKLWQEKLGFVPNVMGVMADSPAVLRGYKDISAAFDGGIFTPAEREIIHMTVSYMNGCDYCVAAHSLISEKAGVPKEIWSALREDRPLKDARLEALRVFVIAVMKRLGHVEGRDLEAFLKAGYTQPHALEVVLGLSINIITNYVNLIARTPLDKAFEPYRLERDGRGGREHREHRDGKKGGKSAA